MAFDIFSFTSAIDGNSCASDALTIADTGEMVRVRFTTREKVNAELEVVSNGVTTRQVIEDGPHWASAGFLAGDQVRVLLKFLTVDGAAAGIVESAV